MNRWPVRRLLLLQVLVVALPLLLLTAYQVWRQARHDMEDAREHSAGIAAAVAGDLDRLFTEAQFSLAVLSQRPQVRAMDGADCDPSLRLYADLNPHFSELALLDPSGRVLCQARGSYPVATIADLGLSPDLVSRGEFFVTPAFVAPASRDLDVGLGYPVRDEQNRLVGFLGAVLDLTRYSEELGRNGQYAGVLVGAVDRDGRFLIRSQAPQAWLGRLEPDLPLLQTMASRGEGWSRLADLEGRERVFSFVTLPGLGWRVFAGIPTETVYANARATGLQGLLLICGTTLLLGLMALAIGRRITRPVGALVRSLEEAGSRWDARVPEEGPREIAAMGRQLNAMLEARATAEAALRRSELYLRRLQEANVIGIVLTHVDGTITDANDAFLSLVGCTQDDLPLQWANLFPPEWRQIRAQAEQALTRQGVCGPYQAEWLRKDGRRIPVLLGASLLDDPTHAIGYAADLSELKIAEVRLRESEARFRRLFEGAPVGIALGDAEGRILLYNGAFARIFGGTREELLGLTCAELTDPADEQQCHQTMAQLQAGVRDQLRLEHRFRTRQGETIWCETDVIVLRESNASPGEATGAIRNLIVVLRDVTERKQVEARLRDNEVLYRTLFESAQDGIFLLQDYRFVACNPRVLELFDVSRDRIVGRSPAEMSPPVQPDGRESAVVARELMDAALAGRAQFFEWRHRRGDGTDVDVEISLSRIEVAGEMLLLAFLRDVTERRQLEAEAEVHRQQLIQADKMVSLGILVSGVAHEINNPNGYIRAGLDVLEPCVRDALTALGEMGAAQDDLVLGALALREAREELPAVLGEMRRGTDRIARIVTELRDFARQTPSELSDKVDANAVVQSAVTLLSNQIKKSTRRFGLEYGEGLPLLHGNFQRLEQVVVNLLLNACQALPDPDAGICVRTWLDRPDGSVVIEVRDEGEGIAAEDLAHITDPFFTTKRTRGGTGLGLSVSSGIVRDHGGRLEFDSSPGKGTTARMRLPLPAPQAEAGS